MGAGSVATHHLPPAARRSSRRQRIGLRTPVVAAVADPGVVDVSTSWAAALPKELLQLVAAGQREELDKFTAGVQSTPEQEREFAFRARPYGTDDLYDVVREVRGYALGNLVQQITTPLLVTSPDKEQFWPGQSQQLYDALPARKELARFTTEQGSGLALRTTRPEASGPTRVRLVRHTASTVTNPRAPRGS